MHTSIMISDPKKVVPESARFHFERLIQEVIQTGRIRFEKIFVKVNRLDHTNFIAEHILEIKTKLPNGKTMEAIVNRYSLEAALFATIRRLKDDIDRIEKWEKSPVVKFARNLRASMNRVLPVPHLSRKSLRH